MKRALFLLALLPSLSFGAGFLQVAHDHTFSFSANTTYYLPPGGIIIGYSTEAPAQVPYHVAGTWSQAWWYMLANTVTAVSTMTLRVNGADTSIVMHLGASSTAKQEDIVHNVHINSGDKVDWKLDVGATGTSMEPMGLLALFSADANSTSRFIDTGANGTTGQTNGFADYYVSIANNMGNGSGQWTDQTDANVLYVVQTTMTCGNLAAYITDNARTVAIPITLFKNRATTGFSLNVPALTTGLIEDTTMQVSLVPGDTAYFQIACSRGSDGNLISASFISMECTTTDGTMEYLTTNPGKGFSAGADNVTTIMGPGGVDSLGTTYQIPSRIVATISHFHFFNAANTLSGNFDVYVRNNGTRGASVIHLTAGQHGQWLDSTDTDALIATDFPDIELVSAAGTGSNQIDAFGMRLTAPATPAAAIKTFSGGGTFTGKGTFQ